MKIQLAKATTAVLDGSIKFDHNTNTINVYREKFEANQENANSIVRILARHIEEDEAIMVFDWCGSSVSIQFDFCEETANIISKNEIADASEEMIAAIEQTFDCKDDNHFASKNNVNYTIDDFCKIHNFTAKDIQYRTNVFVQYSRSDLSFTIEYNKSKTTTFVIQPKTTVQTIKTLEVIAKKNPAYKIFIEIKKGKNGLHLDYSGGNIDVRFIMSLVEITDNYCPDICDLFTDEVELENKLVAFLKNEGYEIK